MAAGLNAELELSGRLRVHGELTDSWRAWIRERRDILVAELRIGGQDRGCLRALVAEMVEDLAAVDRARAERFQNHIETLLPTAPETARAEVARCWASLIACRLPDLPETTLWRWVRVQSRLLGEAFLLVECDDDIDDARCAHPGLVVWTAEEALDLVEGDATNQTIRAVHRVKQRFRGYVLIGSDLPTIERPERPPQADEARHPRECAPSSSRAPDAS
jgi:hypothetical protein